MLRHVNPSPHYEGERDRGEQIYITTTTVEAITENTTAVLFLDWRIGLLTVVD
jgi:hypothetical protein